MRKTKLLIKGKILGAVAVATAFFMGVMPMTAYAGGCECTCEEKCTEDHVNEECDLCKVDPGLCCGEDPKTDDPEDVKPEEPEETKPEEPKKSHAGLYIILFLVTAGGIGGYFWFTKTKSRKVTTVTEDPDADYDENEDDYIDAALDDLDDLDFADAKEEETPDKEDK